MKKSLKEIELSGNILLIIGAIVGHLANIYTGASIVSIGLLLWVIVVIYKALNWQEYRRDNILNIYIMIGAIIALFITFKFIVE